MSQNPNLPALTFLTPQIHIGQTLWMSNGKFLNTRHLNRYPVLVTHAFVGQDDRTYCVLEINGRDLAESNSAAPGSTDADPLKSQPVQYRLVPVLALAPEREGPDFLSLMIDPPQAGGVDERYMSVE